MSDDAGPVCNIAGRGRRRRAGMGVATFVATAALFLALDARFDTRWWRLGLVPLLGFAFLCLLQAQEQT